MWNGVSSRDEQDDLVLPFEDDGTGVPAGTKSRMFDRVISGEGEFGSFFVREFFSLSGMTIIGDGKPETGPGIQSPSLMECSGILNQYNRSHVPGCSD